MATTPKAKKATSTSAPRAAQGKAAHTPARIGAPSKFTPDLADAICAHVADCTPLKAIAKMPGMPSAASILRWLADGDSGKDEAKAAFCAQYTRAREAQAERFADDIAGIADEAEVVAKYEGEDVRLVLDATAVARNRLRIDARKWLASKMAPKRYGDRVEAVHSGTGPGGAIETRVALEFVAPAAPAAAAVVIDAPAPALPRAVFAEPGQ